MSNIIATRLNAIRQQLEVNQIDAGFFRHPHVDIAMVLAATLTVVLAGAIAGLIPALKAAKISPVEAMRD